MKKFLSTLLAIGLVIAMPVLAVAATFTLLNQSVPIEWVDFKNEVDTTTGPEIPHLKDSSDVFWHFVANQLTDEQSPILKATIVFKDSEGKEYTRVLNSYKTLEKMNHYGIYTPFDYVLIKASVDAGIAGNFNLSHVATVPTTTGTTKETTKQTTTGQTTTGTTGGTTKQTTTGTTGQTTTSTTEATTTQTSGTTIESSTSVTTTTTNPTTTSTLPEEFPQTGEAENFQWTVIGLTMLGLAIALTIWRKKLIKQ